MLILFNIVDTIGRKTAPLYILPNWIIVFLSISRIAFFITTYMIAYYDITKPKEEWGALNSDAYIVINMVLFALTNGFVST